MQPIVALKSNKGITLIVLIWIEIKVICFKSRRHPQGNERQNAIDVTK